MNMFKNNLIKKLKNKSARIGIIGLGYVGLPLLVQFYKSGYNVLGFDIDKEKIKKLNNGLSYISHIQSKEILNLSKKKFKVTNNFLLAKEVDALIICVPTPLKNKKEPDLSFIIETTNNLLPYIKKGQVISLESTTYPGTTEEELLPAIESKGFKIGKDFFLVYSPEREDPGNKSFKTKNIPKIVSGHSPDCLDVGKNLYKFTVKKVVPVSSTKTAEITKLLENIYRAVNIGLVNEMKMLTDRMGIDIHEVITAASTKPFGFTPFYPGPGLGGHCIPIDPYYLTWKAKKYGLNTRFIELAGEVNNNMPNWVINKIDDTLKNKSLILKNAKVLVLGIAYKKNIDDMRESPAAELMKILKERNAMISYSDPYVLKFPKMRKYNFNLKSIELSVNKIKKFDIVLIVTDHDKFDYKLLQENAKLIIDTRGVYKKPYHNVINA